MAAIDKGYIMEEFEKYIEKIKIYVSQSDFDLIKSFGPNEQKSMMSYVDEDNIKSILTWIGSDLEIKNTLFWDKGQKFDTTAWNTLTPDTDTVELFKAAKKFYNEMQDKAVKIQRRSDLSLYSQFNDALLFTGLAGAIRVDNKFSGIEFRCIGSVGKNYISISIIPQNNKFVVGFGGYIDNNFTGIFVNSSDNHGLLQVAQLIEKQLPKIGFNSYVRDGDGQVLKLDSKVIRKSIIDGLNVDVKKPLCFFAEQSVATISNALDAAADLMKTFYSRIGIESEVFNISREYQNFNILRDESFDTVMENRNNFDGVIFITATNVCRRCRREIPFFYDFVKAFSNINFVLVNLGSPQFKFYEKVFGDMGGGDAEVFRKTASGVTPFIIVYDAQNNSTPKYIKYFATKKHETLPDKNLVINELGSIFPHKC